MTRPKVPVFMQQFFRYICIGGIAFVFDFSVLTFCVKHLGLSVVMGASAGFIVGALVNYLLCLKFVFSSRRLEKFKAVEILIFFAIGLAGLLINDLVMQGCNFLLSMDYQKSKLVAAAIVLAFNFIVRKIVLFTPAKQVTQHQDTGHGALPLVPENKLKVL